MKLCMIGSRGHCHYVFESLKEVPFVELAAVSSGCEDSPQRLLDGAARCGFTPKVYDDYREMLDREKPDLVSVDGPFDRHAEMCIEALRRNINVFCEKPIALDFASLDEIEKAHAAASAKIVSMVGLRYESAFQHAHELVEAGAVGKVKLIGTRKSYRFGVRPDFYRNRATYGGTIPWVGSHAMDWMIYYGKSGFDTVWACEERSDNFGYGDLEVAAQCLFRMSNGIIAQASIDYLRPAAAPTHGDDRVRIAGTDGVLEVAGGRIMLIDAQGEREIPVPPPKRSLFSDFVLDVAGERPALVDAPQTFLLTRACLAARESADTGELFHFGK